MIECAKFNQNYSSSFVHDTLIRMDTNFMCVQTAVE
jgi:hypothetical protein